MHIYMSAYVYMRCCMYICVDLYTCMNINVHGSPWRYAYNALVYMAKDSPARIPLVSNSTV